MGGITGNPAMPKWGGKIGINGMMLQELLAVVLAFSAYNLSGY